MPQVPGAVLQLLQKSSLQPVLDGRKADLGLKGGSARYQGLLLLLGPWQEVSGAEAENGSQEILPPELWEPQGAAHPLQAVPKIRTCGEERAATGIVTLEFGAGGQSTLGQKESCLNR